MEGSGAEAAAWEARTQVRLAGEGFRGALRLSSRCGRGLAQEGIVGMGQGTQVEQGRGWGEAGRRHGWPLSQSRLQGRVQDVVVMAVAVGVAVVALGAGVVGGLLQPHQHVHLGRGREGEGERERPPGCQPSTLGLLQARAPSSGLPLGCSPQRRPWTQHPWPLGPASRVQILPLPCMSRLTLGKLLFLFSFNIVFIYS